MNCSFNPFDEKIIRTTIYEIGYEKYLTEPTTLYNKKEWLESVYNEMFEVFENKFQEIDDIKQLIVSIETNFNAVLKTQKSDDKEYLAFLKKQITNNEENYKSFVEGITKGLYLYSDVVNNVTSVENLSDEEIYNYDIVKNLINKYTKVIENLKPETFVPSEEDNEMKAKVTYGNPLEDIVNFQAKWFVGLGLRNLDTIYPIDNYLNELISKSVFKFGLTDNIDFNLTYFNSVLKQDDSDITGKDIEDLQKINKLDDKSLALIQKYYRFLLKNNFNLISQSNKISNGFIQEVEKDGVKTYVFADVADAISGNERFNEDRPLDGFEYVPKLFKLFVNQLSLEKTKGDEKIVVLPNENSIQIELSRLRNQILEKSESLKFDDLVNSYFNLFKDLKTESLTGDFKITDNFLFAEKLFNEVFNKDLETSIHFKYLKLKEKIGSKTLEQSEIEDLKKLKNIMVTVLHNIQNLNAVSYVFVNTDLGEVVISGIDNTSSPMFIRVQSFINSRTLPKESNLQKEFTELLNKIKKLDSTKEKEKFNLINNFAKLYENEKNEVAKIQILNQQGNALPFIIINNALGYVKQHLKSLANNDIVKNSLFMLNPFLTNKWYVINEIQSFNKSKEVKNQTTVETYTSMIDYLFTKSIDSNNQMMFYYYVPSDSNTIYTSPIDIKSEITGVNGTLEFEKNESIESRLDFTIEFYRQQQFEFITNKIIEIASLYNDFFDTLDDKNFKKFDLSNVESIINTFKENKTYFNNSVNKKDLLSKLASFQNKNGLAFEKNQELQFPYALNEYIIEEYELTKNKNSFKQNIDGAFDIFLEDLTNSNYVFNEEIASVLNRKMNITFNDNNKMLAYKYYMVLDAMFRDSFDSVFTGGVFVHKHHKGNYIKSYADMTKRAKVLGANKLPLIFTDESLDESSNTLLLTDEKTNFKTIIGDSKDQEYLDGASEMLFLYGILTQESMGGVFGIQVGEVQKTLNIAYDTNRMIPIMEKHAIYPITNERMLDSLKYRQMNKVYMSQIKINESTLKEMKNMKLKKPIVFTVPKSNELIEYYKTLNYKMIDNGNSITFSVDELKVDNVTTVYDLFLKLGGYYAPNNLSHYALADYIAIYPDLKNSLILKQNYNTGRKMGNFLEQKVSSVLEEKELKVQQVSEMNNGMQLNAKHEADSAETTFVGQIFSASITESVNTNEYQQIMEAVFKLAGVETNTFLSALNKLKNDKVSNEEKLLVLKSLHKDIISILKDASSGRYSDQSSTLAYADKVDALLSLDNNQFANLITTTLASFITKKTIRYKFLGGQNIMTPTFGRIEFFDLPFDYANNRHLNGQDAINAIGTSNVKTVGYRVYEQWKSNPLNKDINLKSRDLKWNNPINNEGKELIAYTENNEIDEENSNPIFLALYHLSNFKSKNDDSYLNKVSSILNKIELEDKFKIMLNNLKKDLDNKVENIEIKLTNFLKEMLKLELKNKNYSIPPVEITLPKVYKSTFDLQEGFELFQYDTNYFFLTQLLKNPNLDSREIKTLLNSLKSLTVKESVINKINKLKEQYFKIHTKAIVLEQAFQKSLEGVLARIPAQGMHSFFSFKVVQFTEDTENTVGYPVEVMYFQGADMDIDKGNVMGYDFIVETKKDIERAFDISDEKGIALWEDISYILPFVNKDLDDVEIESLVSKVPEKFKERFLTSLYKNHITKNLILSDRNPLAAIAHNTPISTDIYKEEADRLESKRPQKKRFSKMYVFANSLVTQIIQNRVGKLGVGIAANYLKVFTAITWASNYKENLKLLKQYYNNTVDLFKQHRSFISKKIIFTNFNTNKVTVYDKIANLNIAYLEELAENSNLRGKELIDYLQNELTKDQAWFNLSGGTSAATDNAKEPLLGKLNLTLDNSGMFYSMLSLGIPLGEVVDFLNLPESRTLMSMLDKTKNIFDSSVKAGNLKTVLDLFITDKNGVDRLNKIIDNILYSTSNYGREAANLLENKHYEGLKQLMFEIKNSIRQEDIANRQKQVFDEEYFDFEQEQEPDVDESQSEERVKYSERSLQIKLVRNITQFLNYIVELEKNNMIEIDENNVTVNEKTLSILTQFRLFYDIASENDYLARVFKINQGLPNSVTDIVYYIFNVEKFIYERTGENFDLFKFVNNIDYQREMIESYNKHKSFVNVLWVIASNSQYIKGYIGTGLQTLYDIEYNLKYKMRFLIRFYDMLKFQKNFTEETINNLSRYIDTVIMNEYLRKTEISHYSMFYNEDYDTFLSNKIQFVDDFEQSYNSSLESIKIKNPELSDAVDILLKNFSINNDYLDILTGEKTSILYLGDFMERSKNQNGIKVNNDIASALNILQNSNSVEAKNFIRNMWLYTLIVNKGSGGKYSMSFVIPNEIKMDYNNFLIKVLNQQFLQNEDIFRADNLQIGFYQAVLAGILFEQNSDEGNDKYFSKYVNGRKVFIYRDKKGNETVYTPKAKYKYSAPSVTIKDGKKIITNWFNQSSLELLELKDLDKVSTIFDNLLNVRVC